MEHSHKSAKHHEFFEKSHTLRLGDTAPDFTASSTHGEFHFHDSVKGHWTVLFSICQAFTPVCTTELGQIAKLKSEFDKRGLKFVAVGVNDVDTLQNWLKDVNEMYRCEFDYPFISDVDRKVCMQYNMLHKQHYDANGPVSARYVYIIDPDLTIRLIHASPSEIGRNFEDILRVIDGLLLTSQRKVFLPANWKPGEQVIIPPKTTDEEAQKSFKDVKKIRDYMRLAEQPSK